MRPKFPYLRIPKVMGFWLECHLIMKNCKSEIYWFESDDPVYCYLPRLLVPLPSLLWRLGLAWFGLQCQCWFAEIFPENDHSLVLLLTFAIFISLTYQNDCKTILIKEFMLGMVKTNQLSLSASRLLWLGEFQKMFTRTLAEFCYFNLSRGLKMIAKLFCLKN